MKRILKFMKLNQGMTLVELIVTFAILGILMTATIATLSPAMNVFQKVSAMSRGQSVASILLDKIGSEVETATGNVSIGNTANGTVLGENTSGSYISYLDKDGQEVVMYAGPNTSSSAEKNTETTLQIHYNKTLNLKEGIDWYFSKETYMNEKITSLTFQRIKNTTRIRIYLALENTRTGTTYERTKVVDCFKLDDSSFLKEGKLPGLTY
ncbi:MAG: type II secretion system protein [Anaerostipes sp.]|jgi:prepilin-type N-terminal cleavage/methylation domain-containing protein|nr:type II secretion system protein [Anaerostipes sp.]MDD3745044.1 type II secretion system protein [Anaerostipes sp.]